MFLISPFMFEAVYKPKGFLEIHQYIRDNHVGTFYYFRLGARSEQNKPVDINWKDGLTIPRQSVVQIWSAESFKLSDRVLGLFGTLILDAEGSTTDSLSVDRSCF